MRNRLVARSSKWPARGRSVATAALLCVSPTLARSQDSAGTPAPVMLGTRVRVWQRVASSLAVPVVGRVTRVGSDTVALLADGVSTPVSLSRQAIARVEVSAGRGTGSATNSAIRGAIVGALGGAVLGTIAGNLAKRNAAKLAIAGFGVGGGLGAGVGAALPGEAWRNAALPTAPTPPD